MAIKQNFAGWSNALYTGTRSYDIIGKRKRTYIASGAAVVLCILLIVLRGGFNLGIDFKGGVEFTISGVSSTAQDPAITAVQSVVPDEAPRVATVGNQAVRVQTATISETEQTEVQKALAKAYNVDTAEVSKSFIGPTWGSDVSKKALQGMVGFMVLVAAVMVVYFRSWRLAASAIISLVHDLVITAGVYALVGWEVTPATVIGFLTIAAYSVYDKVVVFDKIRENTDDLFDQTKSTYAERANLAVNQTLVRSINTSVLGLLPVSSILFIGAFILGAGTLRDLALALFVGMAVGAYSSIFLAPPIDVTLRRNDKRVGAHTERVVELRQRIEEGGDATVDELVEVGGKKLIPGHHLGSAAQPKRRKR